VTSSWNSGTLPTSLTRSGTRLSATWSETFDQLGRLSSQTRGTSTGSWSYRGEFETQRVLGAAALKTSLTRDGLGQLSKSVTQVGSAASNYEFSVLRDAGGRTGSYSKKMVLPGTSTQEFQWRGYTYDSVGRVKTTREASALPTLTATSGDEASVVSLSNNVAAGVWTYGREATVGSTVSITKPGASARLSSVTRGAGYQVSNYQVGTSGALSVVYDTAGRVILNAGVTYTWDDFSMLTRVASTGVNEGLQYDGVGRLVARWNGTSLVEEYVWDGDQMVSAINNGGSVVWQAYWGQGTDNLVAVTVGGVEYAAVNDGRGSVGAFYRTSGGTREGDIDYTPEGRATTRNLTGSPVTCTEAGTTSTCAPLLGIPFGFHSAFKSSATGLLYFRNRWYSSVSGEWLSQDPLGPVDSHNLYAFNGLDSVNFRDPLGNNRCGAAGCDFEPAEIEGELYGQGKSPAPPRPEFDDICVGAICAVMGSVSERFGDVALRNRDRQIAFAGSMPAMTTHARTARGTNGGATEFHAPSELDRHERIEEQVRAWGSDWGIGAAGVRRGPLVEVCGSLCQELRTRSQSLIEELSPPPKDAPSTPEPATPVAPALAPGGGTAPPPPPRPPAPPASPSIPGDGGKNWSWRSSATFGHTFSRHGQGPKNTRNLAGRAAGTATPQGQWLDNEAAASWLRDQRSGVSATEAQTTVPLPNGLGQVVLPGGSTVPATHARLVPSPSGGYRSAFPIVMDSP
jgi:RHS repeat-associated protein